MVVVSAVVVSLVSSLDGEHVLRSSGQARWAKQYWSGVFREERKKHALALDMKGCGGRSGSHGILAACGAGIESLRPVCLW